MDDKIREQQNEFIKSLVKKVQDLECAREKNLVQLRDLGAQKINLDNDHTEAMNMLERILATKIKDKDGRLRQDIKERIEEGKKDKDRSSDSKAKASSKA